MAKVFENVLPVAGNKLYLSLPTLISQRTSVKLSEEKVSIIFTLALIILMIL